MVLFAGVSGSPIQGGFLYVRFRSIPAVGLGYLAGISTSSERQPGAKYLDGVEGEFGVRSWRLSVSRPAAFDAYGHGGRV
jgi:hypothetical protein